MAPRTFRVLLLVVVSVVLVGSVLAWRPVRRWLGIAGPDVTSSEERGNGFRESALEAGLTFRMSFLPLEQGEKFKINLYDHGCGVAVADFNGDGHEDIYFTNQLGANALYRNRGDGTFEDVTAQAGVAVGDRICAGATFADYDNDGHPDLFVTSTRGGNLLFHNNGNGTFTDVTQKAGVAHVGHAQTAVFFDYDNDGHLDLLVTQTAQWTTDSYSKAQHYYAGKSLGGAPGSDLLESPKEANLLYHNNGNGTFTEVAHKAGLTGRGWSSDAAVLDYNNDGWPDVLITCMFGPSQLYRNNGDKTFTDVTEEALGPTSYGACGACAFDFNNDGKLDLFLADMHSDMWMGLDNEHKSEWLAVQGKSRKYRHLNGPYADQTPAMQEMDKTTADSLGFRPAQVVYGNTFFKNLGTGKFREMSDPAGLETLWPWSATAGDFDNDGYTDLFLPSGMGYPFYYWPNHLLMNNGNETFTERAAALGMEPPPRGRYLPELIGGQEAPRSSRSAAVADFDGDGRLDLVVNNFNDQPYYFRNNLPRKNYLALRLRGTRSNRDAIGAVVRLYTGKQVLTRQVSPGGGYLSQSSKTVHFGLGDTPQIDRIEIRWPSGAKEVIAGEQLEINKPHERTEPGSR